jgi:hypothetical protein
MTYLPRKLLNTKQQVIFYNAIIVHINIEMYSFLCNVFSNKKLSSTFKTIESDTQHANKPHSCRTELRHVIVAGASGGIWSGTVWTIDTTLPMHSFDQESA